MRSPRFGLSALLWPLFALCCASTAQTQALSVANFTNCVFVVDIRGKPWERKLAASVATGLLNRHSETPIALVLNSPADWKWVAGIRSQQPDSKWIAASEADIVAFAVAVGAATSVIEYSPDEPWALATIVTISGVKSAIPIPQASQNFSQSYGSVGKQTAQPFSPQLLQIDSVPPRSTPSFEWQVLDLKLGLDAFGQGNSALAASTDPFLGVRHLATVDVLANRWKNELDATLWSWANLHSQCENTDDVIAIQRPEVLSHGFLADYVVSQKMFLFFLPHMCSPGPQQVLYRTLVAGAYAKGKQIRVMGYSTEDEVVADCSLHHTEMSVVSDWSPNLSFYSRMNPITGTLAQVPLERAPSFNPNHTYIAIVNSDGDNMQIDNFGNRNGMEDRVQLCSQKENICPPLSWTISNQLQTYAPFQLKWFYDQALKTGHDSFLMGPSGFGFLHPAAIQSDSSILTQYVANTVMAAENLSMTAYVHWDIDSNGLSKQRSSALMSSLENDTGAPNMTQTTIDADSRQHFVPEKGKKLMMHNSVEDPLSTASNSSFGTTGHDPGLAAQGSSRDQGIGMVGTALENTQNSLAREAYIRRYQGSPVNTVFAPGEYKIPEWLGDVAGIQEQFRWGVEMPTEEAIRRANTLPRGTVGYVYKIWNVPMAEFEQFGQKVASHVHILDHRQLHDIALQKKFVREAQSSMVTV